LKRKASSTNSLNIPGSRRNSTEAECLLQSSSTSRRSSHAIHPANLPNLRRLSAISQGTSHPTNISSSRKSSRCDERCLSRRSSNIQQKVKDINAIPTTKAGTSSRTNSSKCVKSANISKEIIINPENKEPDSQLYKESVEKMQSDSDKLSPKPNTTENRQVSQKISNPGLIVGELLINNDKNDRKSSLPYLGIHKNSNTIKPTHKNQIISKSKRSQSSSNILTPAPVHSSSRRSSCVPTQPSHPTQHLPVPTISAQVLSLPAKIVAIHS
jgi:hypothetical protein